MPAEEESTSVEKKNVVVGVRIDSQSRDLLSWALVKVAEPGDCVIAVHVSRRSSDRALGDKMLLDAYLEAYEGLCSVKKVELKGQIFKGNSVRKILVREAKTYSADTVVVGLSKQSTFGGWTSNARYCAKRLPPTTNVLAIRDGKVVFMRRCNNSQLPGLEGVPKPSLCFAESASAQEWQSEFGDSEAGTEISSSVGIQSSRDESRHSSEDSKDDILSVIHKGKKVISRSISLFSEDVLEHKPGWPLLRRVSSGTPQASHARKMSVVQWVMSLPTRSPLQSPRCSTIEENALERTVSDVTFTDESDGGSSSALGELQKSLGMLLKSKSSDCEWFSYEILKAATCQFSSEMLIGKGGCNRVYKGILPDGKPVAVKILKSSKEAWKDFAHEVDIVSSLKHKHIMALIGICIEDNDLISVYDFSSKGSLEENLHGKHALPWGVRYKIAVGIAEALNYLHSEYSQPVIHRDVKSSNILLSDGFEPQLSDFGLAIWGPTTSPFLTQPDVLGTFGYLAPEYFMYGKVSDKIDVYAFGVVLLELLSGKGPIVVSEASKGQESLIMWAKPIIESGDVKGILDPDLDGNINELQMQRMALSATLCTTRSARLRPKMIEILKLLRGDNDLEKWVNSGKEDIDDQDENDDEVYPHSSAELHLGLALLDVDDDSTSFSSVDQRNSLSMEEYLKERWSRSSSFN